LLDFQQCTEDKHPKPSGLQPMSENIISKCGPDLSAHFALVTGLIFGKTKSWTRKNVVSFYAEHRQSCSLKFTDVNNALDKGKLLFSQQGRQNFDLKYRQPKNNPLSICAPPNNCFGVTRNDTLNLEEISLKDCCASKGPNPINCAQFGVNT
jgi:hypothetical protein